MHRQLPNLDVKFTAVSDWEQRVRKALGLLLARVQDHQPEEVHGDNEIARTSQPTTDRIERNRGGNDEQRCSQSDSV
jgi:protein subunit release factor A